LAQRYVAVSLRIYTHTHTHTPPITTPLLLHYAADTHTHTHTHPSLHLCYCSTPHTHTHTHTHTHIIITLIHYEQQRDALPPSLSWTHTLLIIYMNSFNDTKMKLNNTKLLNTVFFLPNSNALTNSLTQSFIHSVILES